MKMEYNHQTIAYRDDEQLRQVAWELLSYSAMLFQRVYVFKHIDKFANELASANPGPIYWEVLSYERLIDQIKICTAFENYNKAVLLLHGYVVHIIDYKKHKKLSEDQRRIPISIMLFKEHNNFVPQGPDNKLVLDGLTHLKTISLATTLSVEYQKVVQLEPRFLSYLKRLNEERNRLHFLKNYPGAFNLKSYADEVRYACSYGLKRISEEIQRVEGIMKNDM